MAAPQLFSALDSASLAVVLECLGPREAVKLTVLSATTRKALAARAVWRRKWRSWCEARWGTRVSLADDAELSHKEAAESGASGDDGQGPPAPLAAAARCFWEEYYAKRSSTWIPMASPMKMFQET